MAISYFLIRRPVKTRHKALVKESINVSLLLEKRAAFAIMMEPQLTEMTRKYR